jgi:hypothetical protein
MRGFGFVFENLEWKNVFASKSRGHFMICSWYIIESLWPVQLVSTIGLVHFRRKLISPKKIFLFFFADIYIILRRKRRRKFSSAKFIFGENGIYQHDLQILHGYNNRKKMSFLVLERMFGFSTLQNTTRT